MSGFNSRGLAKKKERVLSLFPHLFPAAAENAIGRRIQWRIQQLTDITVRLDARVLALGVLRLHHLLLACFVALGCSVPDEPNEPSPSPLPGLQSSPCALTTSLYRVSQVRLAEQRGDIGSFTLDFGYEGEHLPNAHGYLVWASDAAAQLNTALATAVAEHRLVWMLAVETCADEPYARVSAYEGAYDGATYALVQGTEVAAVGELDPSTRVLTASHGIGRVPLGALSDPTGTAEPGWTYGDAAGVRLEFNDDGTAEGVIALGLRDDRHPVYDALLRPFYGDQAGWLGAGARSDIDMFAWWKNGRVDEYVYWPRVDGEPDRLSLGAQLRLEPVAP